MLTSIQTFFQGYKTYILAALGVVYIVAGYYTGHIDATTALGLLFAPATVTTIRAAISSVQAVLPPPQG